MVRKRKKEKMRRFSNEQIERLEVMFESATKERRDSNLLLSNYNILSSHFESIKIHNQALLTQENNCQETAAGGTSSTSDGESVYYTKTESQVKCVTQEGTRTKEEEEALNMLEEAEENDQLLNKLSSF